MPFFFFLSVQAAALYYKHRLVFMMICLFYTFFLFSFSCVQENGRQSLSSTLYKSAWCVTPLKASSLYCVRSLILNYSHSRLIHIYTHTYTHLFYSSQFQCLHQQVYLDLPSALFPASGQNHSWSSRRMTRMNFHTSKNLAYPTFSFTVLSSTQLALPITNKVKMEPHYIRTQPLAKISTALQVQWSRALVLLGGHLWVSVAGATASIRQEEDLLPFHLL